MKLGLFRLPFVTILLAVLAAPLVIPAAVATPVTVAPAYEIIKSFGDPEKSGTQPVAGPVESPDGWLYGTTLRGGRTGGGTLYRVRPDGLEYRTLHHFGEKDPLSFPSGRLLDTGDGFLYGTTAGSADPMAGAAYSYNKTTGALLLLKQFSGSVNPRAGMILGSDGALYGTGDGDVSGSSIVFKINRDGGGYRVLRSFNGSGGSPGWCRAPLWEGSDGALYGTTFNGGAYDRGTVFKLNRDGASFQVLRSFGSSTNDGMIPAGGVIEGGDGLLHGLLESGAGNQDYGAAYSINKNGTGFRLLRLFDYDLYRPAGEFTEGPDGRLYGVVQNYAARSRVFSINRDGTGLVSLGDPALLPESASTGLVPGREGWLYGAVTGNSMDGGALFRVKTTGEGPATIWRFSASGGESPAPLTLTEGNDKWIYGVTEGSSSQWSAFFKIRRDGTGHTMLREFIRDAENKGEPVGPLIQLPDGGFYGSTYFGGLKEGGALIRLSPDGNAYDFVHEFKHEVRANGDPSQPFGLFHSAADGALYGASTDGGSAGHGTVYKINPDGSDLTILHNFGAGTEDDANPGAPLAGSDGRIYGIARNGLYSLNRDGTDYRFNRVFFYSPGLTQISSVMEASDGIFYGVGSNGGPTGAFGEAGGIFKVNRDGGGYSIIHVFEQSGTNPYFPAGNLVEGPDGFLYGVTHKGGEFGDGVLYRVSRSGGGFEVLQHFSYNRGDGTLPSMLIRGGDGMIYGTARQGGAWGFGAIFRYGEAPEIAVEDAEGASLVSGAAVLDFGEQAPGGQFTVLKLILKSTGRLPLSLGAFSIEGPQAADFSLDFPVIRELAPLGGSMEIDVRARPSAAGVKNAVLRLTNGDYDENPFEVRLTATVPAPEIAVYAGPESGAEEIVSGQAAPVEFGTARRGEPLERSFSVLNQGIAPLSLSRVTVPAGFSAATPLPAEVAPGQSLTLRIIRDTALLGVLQGQVTLESNDPDEALFAFPVRSTVVDPEIVIHDGAAVSAPELTSGQAAVVNFGIIRQGAPVTRPFTIANTGTAPLLVRKITAPPGFSLVNPPALPVNVPVNEAIALQIRLDAAAPGPVTGTVEIESDDFDESRFTFPVSGTVVTPEIAVYDGLTEGAELTSGQSVAVEWGAVRQGTPSARLFSVANTGTAPLLITAITAPPGFSVTAPAEFPLTVETGTVLIAQVQLNAAAPGPVAGTVEIQSDDLDESSFTFPVSGTVVTPEITLHAGATSGAPGLTSGQAGAVDFGEARQTVPVEQPFTIGNTGTAPLLISEITAPPGFSLNGLPALPAAVPVSGALTFQIRLDAAALGMFSGIVVIQSDDLDEASFTFTVSGAVTAPEIALRAGADAAAPELVSGQSAAVGFGRGVQGTPETRSFTIVNTGTAPLRVSALTVPEGYTLSAPAAPFNVTPDAALTFDISLTALTPGTHAGIVSIASDDLDEALFTFPVTGEVYIPAPEVSLLNTEPPLNRQTGLREQTVRLTNDTTATVPAWRILIRGLPPGVTVRNAAETRADGTAVILVRRPLGPRSTFDLVLEYHSANRQPGPYSPQITAEVVLENADAPAAEGAGVLAVERVLRLEDGAMLIEFTSKPGHSYEVQYSAGGQGWTASEPRLTATANRTQWIDRGPPRTASPPAAGGSRLYRVRKVEP